MHSKGWSWSEKRRASGLIAELNCPFCDDREKKFAVSLVDGAFNCMHQNKCGVKGSFWDLQKRLGDKPQALIKDNYIQRPEKIEYKPIKKVDRDELSGQALGYLESRGFKKEILDKFFIRQTKDGQAIMYPFIKDNKTVNIKYRAIKEKKFWNEIGGEPCLFNRDIVKDHEILYITEGQDDCIALKHFGIDGVSVPSGVGDARWIEHEWNFLEGFKTIVLIFDNDKAGNDAVLNVATRLGKWRCFKIVLPYKDVNECLLKKLAPEKFFEVLTNPVEFDDKIKKAIDFQDEIIELNNNKEKLYGTEIDFPGLNNILRGWRAGELTIWTGRNSAGKSTALNQIVLNLLDKKEPCMIASLEMSPKHYIRWGIIQHCRQSVLTDDLIKKTLKQIGNGWFIFNIRGNVNPDVMIESFQYAARKYGIKFFIIDSLMKLSFSGHNELSEQKEFMRKITDFNHEYNVHTHLVAHPRKGFKDSDQPDKVDVGGSGNITDAADNVIVFYRFTPEQKEKSKLKCIDTPDTLATVKKNREWGTEGIVQLKFDENIKRFELFKDENFRINSMDYIHD
jgi:twinkle protein